MTPRSILTCAALLSTLWSCSGSGSGTQATSSVSIAMTDAASDELEMFEVDVGSVVLVRLDGSRVSVMARRARVDFVQLSSLVDLLVGASVPVGVYKSMELTLDFSDAQVCLAGKTTSATVLDANGSAISGVVTVDVAFASSNRPNVAIGRNHLFMLDLDLDQSVSVDTAANTVTFTPVATVEVDPLNLKPVATTGLLDAVDIAGQQLVVKRQTRGGADIGTYVVTVTSTTVYQIDGVTSVGAAGLTALSGVPLQSRIWVQGAIDRNERKLIAAAIETGAGTPGNGQDWVVGHIVGRDNGAGSSATLTVAGMSLDISSNVRQINTLHTISVDLANTKVLKRLSGTGLTTDALNIGQRIAAFGVLAGTALDATGAGGTVRMLPTSVWGVAAAAPSGGTMTLNLSRIGLRAIGQFNFTVATNPQAAPTAYKVGVGSLSTTGITTGSKMRVIGFVNPVDVPSDDDLTAESMVDRSTTNSLLLCQWIPAVTSAISSSTSSEITLDVSAALIKQVTDGFGTTALSNSPTPAKLQPLLPIGIYRIVQGGAVELHVGFESFVQSLGQRIGPSGKVFRIAALGTFEASTQTQKTYLMSVILL
ncbi:MAG: DUF4382 domain-containing protein [Planctomycetes bacterium]|nr:DUF4382 domain-containing protein [Planctomycetota bacterium]MCB9869381.1 DUF4382 domain-containing protein [Planctomycetota bacterium]MCB9888562.1 DUF4382 domain-containing protein [Planctomycetota bacterium]